MKTIYKGDDPSRIAQQDRVTDSAQYLADNMHRCPALLIPVLPMKLDGMPNLVGASMYAGVMPAAWSFCLAARERGIGTSWTTIHLMFEEQVAEILGIPFAETSQVALIAMAYTQRHRLQARQPRAARAIAPRQRLVARPLPETGPSTMPLPQELQPRSPPSGSPRTCEPTASIGPDVSVAKAEPDPVAAGIGFMGEVAPIDITYDGDTDAPTRMVAKIPTNDETIRGLLAPAQVFEREARFYQDVAPKLGDLVPEALLRRMRRRQRRLLPPDGGPRRQPLRRPGSRAAPSTTPRPRSRRWPSSTPRTGRTTPLGGHRVDAAAWTTPA